MRPTLSVGQRRAAPRQVRGRPRPRRAARARPISGVPASSLSAMRSVAWPCARASCGSDIAAAFAGTSKSTSSVPLRRCGPLRQAEPSAPGHHSAGSKSASAAGGLHLPAAARLPGRLPGEPGARRARLQRSPAQLDALARRRGVEIELHACASAHRAAGCRRRGRAARGSAAALLRPRAPARREPVVGLQVQVAREAHRRRARVERARRDVGQCRVECRARRRPAAAARARCRPLACGAEHDRRVPDLDLLAGRRAGSASSARSERTGSRPSSMRPARALSSATSTRRRPIRCPRCSRGRCRSARCAVPCCAARRGRAPASAPAERRQRPARRTAATWPRGRATAPVAACAPAGQRAAQRRLQREFVERTAHDSAWRRRRRGRRRRWPRAA